MNKDTISVVLFVITFAHGALAMQNEMDVSLPTLSPLQVQSAYRQLLNKFTNVQKQPSDTHCYGALIDLRNDATQLVKNARDMQGESYKNRIVELKRRINQYIKDLFPQSPQQRRRN